MDDNNYFSTWLVEDDKNLLVYFNSPVLIQK